jgi:hypothetical protein
MSWALPRTGALAAVAGLALIAQPASASSSGCDVTHPNGAKPPAPALIGRPGDWYGEDGLYVNLGPRMTVLGVPRGARPRHWRLWHGGINRDGSITTKVPWQREPAAYGRVRVTGHPLSGPPARLRTQLPTRRPNTSAFAGSVTFARPGCWAVVTRAGPARMRFVVRVLRQRSR